MAMMLAKFVGKEFRWRLEDFHAQRPGHDRRYALDGSKLASLGWKAPVDFESSLERTVQWTLQHQEWLR